MDSYETLLILFAQSKELEQKNASIRDAKGKSSKSNTEKWSAFTQSDKNKDVESGWKIFPKRLEQGESAKSTERWKMFSARDQKSPPSTSRWTLFTKKSAQLSKQQTESKTKTWKLWSTCTFV